MAKLTPEETREILEKVADRSTRKKAPRGWEALEERYTQQQEKYRIVQEAYLTKDAECAELRGVRDAVSQELIFLEQLLDK